MIVPEGFHGNKEEFINALEKENGVSPDQFAEFVKKNDIFKSQRAGNKSIHDQIDTALDKANTGSQLNSPELATAITALKNAQQELKTAEGNNKPPTEELKKRAETLAENVKRLTDLRDKFADAPLDESKVSKGDNPKMTDETQMKQLQGAFKSAMNEPTVGEANARKMLIQKIETATGLKGKPAEDLAKNIIQNNLAPSERSSTTVASAPAPVIPPATSSTPPPPVTP
jgi:hypothetical protein